MRIRPVIVLVCVLALGAVGAVWLGRDAYDPTAGPIDSSQNGLGYSQPLEVGQDFSIGITTLRNRGKKPVVVERVRLLGVTGALELLGVNTRLFPQGDVGIFIGEFGFPPAAYPSKPLAEQNVVPVPKPFNPTSGDPEGLELVIGIRATRPGYPLTGPLRSTTASETEIIERPTRRTRCISVRRLRNTPTPFRTVRFRTAHPEN